MTQLLDRVACVAPRRPPRSAAEAARGCRVVELRLDLAGYGPGETREFIERAAAEGAKTIVTLRDAAEGGRYTGPPREKLDTLLRALDQGAWMIDVEYRFPLLDEALSSAPGRVIASIHLGFTPAPELLYSYAGDMLRRGAAVAKIVTTARPETWLRDNWSVLGVNARWPGRAAAFAMGREGRLSRILAPLVGAALTYVHVGEPSAPGQLSLSELLKAWRLLGIPAQP